MKLKYINIYIVFFFVFVITAYILTLYLFARRYHGWIIGDWLINYEAGFVRRGLSGYLILNLSEMIHSRPNFLVMGIQIIFYISYMGILLKLLYNKKTTFWYLLLLISPVTLLFPILGNETTGRKEIILFLIFGFYILSLQRHKLKSRFVVILFSLSLFVTTFLHELVFFYTPHFILAAYLKSRIDHEHFDILTTFKVILGSVLAASILFFAGEHLNKPAVCESLLRKGLPEEVCQGLLAFPENFGVADLFEHAFENHYIRNFSISILLGIIPFLFFIRSTKISFVNYKSVFITLFLLFLFSLPLFLVGIDWGRWININFVLILFTSTILLDEAPAEKGFFNMQEIMELPSAFKNHTLNSLFIIIFMILYSSFWYMGNCRDFNVFSNMIYFQFNIFYKMLF